MLLFLALELRDRCPRLPVGLWIDAVAGVLAIAAIGFGIVLPLLMPGSVDDVTKLAFPVVDIALMAMVVAMFTIARWQPGRDWIAWGVAMVALAFGDLLWASETGGAPSSLVVSLWSAAMVAAAAAPWQGSRAIPPATMTVATRLIWPFALFLASFGIVVAGNFVTVWPAGLWLAVAAIIVAAYRTLDSYVQMRHMPETHRLARTDELTGLANRRGSSTPCAPSCAVIPGARPRCSCSTSTASRSSTTRSAIRPATSCSASSGRACSPALRAADTLARLGGDEFAVLCPGAGRRAGAPGGQAPAGHARPVVLARRPAPARRREHRHRRPSRRRHDRRGAAAARRRRDVPGQGRGQQVVEYDASRDEHSRDKLALIGELRRALEHADELVLHYQPQADLRTGASSASRRSSAGSTPTRGLLAPGRVPRARSRAPG